ncbi:MAG: SCO family protein [Alcaligenaceae bacterium]|nr:SCO family protein [Alcaligenaceae bacterium]
MKHKLIQCLCVCFFIASSVVYAVEMPLDFKLQRLSDDGKVEEVTPATWTDKYLLMAVGYTTCPQICPTTLFDVSAALETLDKIAPAQVQKLQPIFLTIDPQSDSLEDMKKYTAYFDSRIAGVRAVDYPTLDYVVKQLHASYSYQFEGNDVQPPNLPKGYTVSHSVFIYLYSPQGELLDAYPYNMDGESLAMGILENMPK